jgi:hypothetical protein
VEQFLRRAVSVCGLVCLASMPADPAYARQASVVQPGLSPALPLTRSDQIIHTPTDFAGDWDYNAEESVNAATGRPEQNPKSATQRAVAARGAGAAPAGGGGAGGGGGFGGGAGAGAGAFRGGVSGPGMNVGPTPDMLQESRDLSRDLLEIPESLTIRVNSETVTIVDDLERQRTYPTDNTKQKYRLGAAEFDARARWEGSQLKKDIEGAYGFKMTETYLLSPDGERLFVILRVGDPTKSVRDRDRPGVRLPAVVGANRVYDRVAR